MKKLFTILCMLVTLSVTAQQITPQAVSICFGDSVQLTATDNNGTYRHIWSNLPDTNVVVVNPTVTTTYTVTILVDSSSVYVGQATATVTVNQIPTATASNGGPYCEMGSILLQSSGGSTYAWTGPLGFTSSFQNPTIGLANVNMSGTYTVTVTDGNGCSASASTNVVVNSLPTANAGSNSPVCVGNTIGLTASGGVSYVWSGPGAYSSNAQNPIRTNATLAMGGNYSVTVTDGNGCVALATTPVVVNPNPTVTAGSLPVSCFGDSTGLVSVSQNGLSYLWNTGDTTQTVNGLPTGNYSVTVTNSFGCSATGTTTITGPSAALSATTSTTDASCNGNANGSITVNGAGGTPPYQYSLNNGPWMAGLSYTFTGLAAGTYTIDVRDVNACQITLTASVFQPSTLTANADSISPSCFGGNNGAVWVAVTGGTPFLGGSYQFLWSNGTTTNGQQASAGTYSVVVTDSLGCTATSSTVVIQPATIGLSAQVTPVTCNGGNNGSIDLSVSGGTSPFTYLWSNGFTGQDPQGLIAGSDTVIVTDANGCTATGAWVVSQPSALVLTTSTTDATCLANGSASVSVSGGTGPYNYSWSGNNGTNTSISAPAGNYTVTVTDANGCQAFDLVTIGTPVPVGVSDVITPIACYAGNNGAIDLTVTGVSPFTYVWSNGTTTQDLNNLGWGNYSVIITAANGCDTTLTFSLTQPAYLSASASATNALCYGGTTGSATVLATGGTAPLSFSWSPSGGNGSTANNLPAGAYTVTVTDANGCSVQANTVVSEPSQLLAVISNQQNIACAGNSNGSATVSVVGGTPNYSLLWSTGAQTQTAYGLSTGSYTITVTDANGCQATTTATISTTGSTLYANMTSDPSCGNSNTGSVTASVSGGQQPYVYQWSNGASSPSVSGLAPGTYSVTITDANGCSWQSSQQILGSPDIVVNLTSQVLCEGNNDIVNATFTGGTWPYQFTWTTPLGNTFTTQNINPSQEGVYELLIVDNFGCTGYGMMPVDLIPCNTTGIDDISEEDINIFPNPISFNGTVTIQLPSNIDEVHIEVRNMVGQILLQEKTNNDTYSFNTSGLAAGTYFVQVATANHSAFARKKLVVQ